MEPLALNEMYFQYEKSFFDCIRVELFLSVLRAFWQDGSCRVDVIFI
jgi:hypothetical protein